MITTVTLNPMLDKTVHVDHLDRGSVHRATRMDLVVGGKGVNVSRELKMLGEETLATGFFGGEIGDLLQRLLNAERMLQDFVRVRGMTREGVTYLESDGRWSAVFEPPHAVTPDEAEQLIARCSRLLEKSSWIVCSGSSPGPEADEIYASVIRRARELGVPSVLDSYGEAFRKALRTGPTMIQCNRQELSKNLSLQISSARDVHKALETLLGYGAAYAVMTDGAGPLYATMGEIFWKVRPPEVRSVNTTGSGDTMVAAILSRLLDDAPFEEALRYGVAAGAANAAKWDVAAVTETEIQALLPQVKLTTM
jgi:tagatose 6-phosphate kinase